jgi:hypothetical protein
MIGSKKVLGKCWNCNGISKIEVLELQRHFQNRSAGIATAFPK